MANTRNYDERFLKLEQDLLEKTSSLDSRVEMLDHSMLSFRQQLAEMCDGMAYLINQVKTMREEQVEQDQPPGCGDALGQQESTSSYDLGIRKWQMWYPRGKKSKLDSLFPYPYNSIHLFE
ncbi:hypothetical protein ACLOJK_003404 [Asimina triloba]